MHQIRDHLIVLDHLKKIGPRLCSLAGRETDPDFYDELRQRTALAIISRLHKGQPVTVPISIGVANHTACDMVSERHRQRQRFISFTDAYAADEWSRDESRGSAGTEQRDPTFESVWEMDSRPHLRNSVKGWRKSLRPQERRVLRGLRRGFTQAEMAAREGIPPGTVATWKHRACRRLEALLN